jgi:hypothetical protein
VIFKASKFKIKVMLQSTVSWTVHLGVKHPSGDQDHIFITVRQLQVCWSRAPSQARGRICHLQLLLALTSAVILGSESSGTHDHVLLSQIRYSLNLEGQVPVFIFPRNRLATGWTREQSRIQVPVGSKMFSSPRRQDWLWGPSSLLTNGHLGLFPHC